MKRIINYLKNDYNNVKWTLKCMSKDRLPDWAIFMYYWIVLIILLPVIPFVLGGFKIWMWYMLRKIDKLNEM